MSGQQLGKGLVTQKDKQDYLLATKKKIIGFVSIINANTKQLISADNIGLLISQSACSFDDNGGKCNQTQ